MQAPSNEQQAYLVRAVDLIRRDLLPATPTPLLVTYGWPSSKATALRHRTIGECWGPSIGPAGYKAAIFISPTTWTSPVPMLAVLVHEMIHAEVPDAGHRKPFSQRARAVGLVKPWTQTTPGEELSTKLERIAEELGPMPAGGIEPKIRKRPGSRLRLWTCDCGTKVRIARDDWRATCDDCLEPFRREE